MLNSKTECLCKKQKPVLITETSQKNRLVIPIEIRIYY